VKNTSQQIINNVSNITNEQSKQVSSRFNLSKLNFLLQHKALKLLAEGNVSGGAQGDEDSIENWFDRVTEKLMAEFAGLTKCAEKVLSPPPKGHGI
jgi:hypothetical protein